METTTDLQTEEEALYPSLSKRFKSNIIDGITIVVVMVALSEVFSFFPKLPEWAPAAALVFLFGIYEPLFTAIGCTLGQKVMGIRVRQYNDSSKKINIVHAYLRFVVKFFLGIFSFFTISSNEERRAIHDMVSGTVVIEYKD